MKHIGLIFILINLFSCNFNRNKDNEIIYLNTNELIRDEGHYCLGKQFLKVYVIDDEVQYVLTDSIGNILIKNTSPSISNIHNWGILLDDKEQLWIESSDIGLYVALKDSSGKYKLKGFDYVPHKKDVPEKIYDMFPSSIRKE